jgi:hypothetical protein
VVGILNPRHGVATVERIAVNAVMAGCRPAYLPVLIALAEACADPAFDLHGVLVTGGLTAPLVIVSGPVVKDINLNYSYSTLGPGWRANTTIGRASRLLFINISQAWPGVNDMKELGNPAKFGMVMAENDDQTPAGWATMREREGFPKDASTVSIYACVSFRQFHDSQKYLGKPATKVDPHIARQLATSLNATAEQWGEEIIVAFGPVQANNMAKLGYTPEKIQEELWTEGRIERKLFGPRPLGAFAVGSNIPAWIDEAPDDAMIPVVPTAKDVKIIVAGGSGPGTGFVIDRWGFGNSKLVTKKVALPANWPALVGDLKGWETPIEVK